MSSLDAEGSLGVDASIELAAQVASAIDALHAQGIVHRDVKPSNVMLDVHGQAAVTDFGLAKGPAYTVLTVPGQVMGTLDYIAPELIRGEESGPPGDVYALGCMVYECLSGSPPFGDRHVLDRRERAPRGHARPTSRKCDRTCLGRSPR